MDEVVLSIWLDLALERIARAVLLLFLILGRRCDNDTVAVAVWGRNVTALRAVEGMDQGG